MRNLKKRLTVLSVPIARLARVLLGPPILHTLREIGDVAIVSPFADNANFQQEFGSLNTRFLRWQMIKPPRQPLRAMLAVSEYLRLHGYWRRFSSRGMAYYLANSARIFEEDGSDRERATVIRMILGVVSVIGVWPGAWRLLDRLIGPFMFRFQELRDLALEYELVTLVQSASWGIQDRMLAWEARQNLWRTALITYTTDQLFINGYLMSDFDAVCVQGPFEERCAREFHDIPFTRVVRLGSAWFRHIDWVMADLDKRRAMRGSKTRRTIMYAGLSNLYFPAESERRALAVLVQAIADQKLVDVELVYRPVVTSEASRKDIEDLWGSHPYVRLQWPQNAMLGLGEYGDKRMSAELADYGSQILEADVIVMSISTTLNMEAAYFGIPSIAILADPSGTLDSRSMSLQLDEMGRQPGFPSVPCIRTLDELVPLVHELLESKDSARQVASQIPLDWDFPATDFKALLIEAVTGSHCRNSTASLNTAGMPSAYDRASP